MNTESMNKIRNILTDEELIKINNFFERVYYDNDLIEYQNCFDYVEGMINAFDIIDVINEYDLKINIEYKY